MKLRADTIGREVSLKLALARTNFLIEKFKDPKFAQRVNMDTFIDGKLGKVEGPDTKKTVYHCGAVGCLAGHAVMEFAPEAVKIDAIGDLYYKGEEVYPDELAGEFLRGDVSDLSFTGTNMSGVEPADEALYRLIRHADLLKKAIEGAI